MKIENLNLKYQVNAYKSLRPFSLNCLFLNLRYLGLAPWLPDAVNPDCPGLKPQEINVTLKQSFYHSLLYNYVLRHKCKAIIESKYVLQHIFAPKSLFLDIRQEKGERRIKKNTNFAD